MYMYDEDALTALCENQEMRKCSDGARYVVTLEDQRRMKDLKPCFGTCGSNKFTPQARLGGYTTITACGLHHNRALQITSNYTTSATNG